LNFITYFIIEKLLGKRIPPLAVLIIIQTKKMMNYLHPTIRISSVIYIFYFYFPPPSILFCRLCDRSRWHHPITAVSFRPFRPLTNESAHWSSSKNNSPVILYYYFYTYLQFFTGQITTTKLREFIPSNILTAVRACKCTISVCLLRVTQNLKN
jgi:hypothetical protein